MHRRPDPAARWRGVAPAMEMKFAAALLVLIFAVIGLAAAPSASAHTTRIATDPAENAQLSVGPSQVSAMFNEPLQKTFFAMTVVGPDGNLWSTGDPRVDGAVISVALGPLGPAGTYTVNYRVTSADGHVVTGSWAFRLTTPGIGTPGAPAASTQSGGGTPVWPFVVAAAVIVVGGVLWAVRRRR